jgi:hypothetical protein
VSSATFGSPSATLPATPSMAAGGPAAQGTAFRVNVRCVTPLGDDVASMS